MASSQSWGQYIYKDWSDTEWLFCWLYPFQYRKNHLSANRRWCIRYLKEPWLANCPTEKPLPCANICEEFDAMQCGRVRHFDVHLFQVLTTKPVDFPFRCLEMVPRQLQFHWVPIEVCEGLSQFLPHFLLLVLLVKIGPPPCQEDLILNFSSLSKDVPHSLILCGIPEMVSVVLKYQH